MRDDDGVRVYLDRDGRQVPGGPRQVSDTPFCLGILGDFSGRGSRPEPAEHPDLGSLPLFRVTPDNVLRFAGLSPELELLSARDPASSTTLRFSELDDFHPDRIFERQPLFEELREERRGILEGEADSSAISETEPGVPPGPDVDRAPAPGSQTGGGLLDAVLDETEQEMPGGPDPLDEDLDAFVRRVVRPHRLAPAAERTEALEGVGREIADAIGTILENQGFQALESLWRSVVFLLSRIQVGTQLRIYLIDVTRAELESDLLSSNEPEDWSLANLLLWPTSEHGEDIRWAALVGAYEFGADLKDPLLLQRIGLLAEAAEVPWLSAGNPALMGCPSLSEWSDPRDWTEPVDPLWDQLRRNPEAAWLGLSLPGFLLRNQYGRSGDGPKAFELEGSHTALGPTLWGNSAFLCAAVMGRAFAEAGWDLRLTGRHRVEGIPSTYPEEGDTGSVAHTLTHDAADTIGEAGLIPILGSRNEPGAFLPRLRSLSAGGGNLGAWWLP